MEAKKTTFKNHLSALALSAGILLGGETPAQQPTRLTPEQQKTVQVLKNIGYNKKVADIDPVLVSKYMVFSKDWLKVIGNDRSKQVTREQFKTWTDSLDKVYECYKEFMGKGPYYMDAIFVGVASGGTAYAHRDAIKVNIERREVDLKGEMRKGNPTHIMLHEMGHIFSDSYAEYVQGNHLWYGEAETAAELLVSYALEQGGFKMGYPTVETGPRRRYGTVNNALNNYRTGKIKDFGYHEGTAYEIYMLSLPNFVGWDTIKKAVQSYDKNNNTYTKTKTYNPGNNKQGYFDADVKSLNNSRAHEFFDRISYFHDQARELAKTDPKVMQGIPQIGRNLTGDQIFNSFPDRGALRAKYFTVETTPIENVQIASEPPKSAVIQTSAVEAKPSAQAVKPPYEPKKTTPVITPKVAVRSPGQWYEGLLDRAQEGR